MQAMQSGLNLIVPDTASTERKTKEMVDLLASNNYELKVVCVLASKVRLPAKHRYCAIQA